MNLHDAGATALSYLPWVVTAAAAVAAALPKPTTPGLKMFIRQVIDAAAFNFGNAKNAP